MSAAFVPVHLHRRDIDPCFTQARRYFYDTARLVLVVYNQCRSFPEKFAVSPSISQILIRPPPIDAPDHFQLSPALSGHLQPNGIRCAFIRLIPSKRKRKPCLFASAKLSGIRGSSTANPNSPATIARSVPCPRPVARKRAVQPDLCIHDLFSQSFPTV